MDNISLGYFAEHKKNLTASLAAWLLAYFPDSAVWETDQFQSLVAGVEGACQQSKLVTVQKAVMKRDTQASERIAKLPAADAVVRVFTDYEVAKETICMPGVMLVEQEEDADFVLTVKHFRNFTTLPLHQRVCQFPFEAGLIRKDLLPLTVRRDCYIGGVSPKWWLPCFDLSTEFHLFADEYKNRVEAGSPNRWIIKPAQGTRGLGHQIVASQDTSGLQQAAAFAPQLTNDLLYLTAGCAGGRNTERIHAETLQLDGVDRVAQLLVDKPLLVQGRKFDVRVFVFVRSFEPFEAYTHVLYYARLANKAYDESQLRDPEVSITVSAYDENQEIAGRQERLLNVDLRAALEQDHPGIDYAAMEAAMRTLLSELFRGAAGSIGQWPQSSAYYSVDVIFDNATQFAAQHGSKEARSTDRDHSAEKSSENKSGASTSSDSVQTHGQEGAFSFTPVPKLVEVNFMGDWHGVEAAVHHPGDYHQWAADLITVLATTQDVSGNEQLIAL